MEFFIDGLLVFSIVVVLFAFFAGLWYTILCFERYFKMDK